MEEKKEAPAPAAPEVRLTPEEQAMVDSFAEKIDITNSQQVLQYGSACQKKIGDFSEAALSKVSTKDLGEVGNMITDLIGELKSFDAGEEQQKGILGFFKKKGDQLDALMQNEKLAAETKDELKAASDAAAEALKELAQAQLDADAAMQNYQQVMASGTEDLDKLEAAAEQAGHAAESLAAANGKASDATDALAKSTQKASDEADKASKTGAEAVETIAQALQRPA